ncbi:MAG: protein translocase subunit SecD [Gammaproteobacteria bacterium]|nr:MAG: protein translocase subunit SecD [Gammaproteobacteria bacterium]
MNRYPIWKNLLILAVLVIGFIYALPNIYAPDPAIQVSTQSSAQSMDEAALQRARKALADAGVVVTRDELKERSILLRLQSRDDQLKAQSVIKRALGDDYVVALNMAPTTPSWLMALGAGPMKLGLDLSGGVHFLMEVDTDAALAKRLDGYMTDIKTRLREARIRGLVVLEGQQIVITLPDEALYEQARALVDEQFQNLQRNKTTAADGSIQLQLGLSPAEITEIESHAVNQNLTTLRNRVNELGVAEPLVQKQGRNRIVVELPGVQDTAEAKRVLGKTANLEFRLEARPDAPAWERETFEFRDAMQQGRMADLERKVIINGEQVSTASASFDENGSPQVNISLDGQGGKQMHRATRSNIGRNLGVLFIERKTRTRYVINAQGEEVVVRDKYDEKKIISLATVRDALGVSFRITGLDSPAESSELALLLRAGALAAPMDFIEERTVGPSLGKENIELGIKSIQLGMLLVVLYMVAVYRLFGVLSNVSLFANLVLLSAVMSMMSATLTLPGIAGIVLTLGMAVDANILIFSRIKEELKNGLPPQSAISAGFDRAFLTILDANLTTLIIALILYIVGTGPIRGFAVTLSVGIVTSMFTAIMVTRAQANLIYGWRKLDKLGAMDI